jgi:hypothetical protein
MKADRVLDKRAVIPPSAKDVVLIGGLLYPLRTKQQLDRLRTETLCLDSP